jgi:hypothetical protein
VPDFELMFAIRHPDDDTIDAIYDRYDDLVSHHADLTLLAITAEGPNAQDAARQLVTDLERHTKTRVLECVEEDHLPDDEELAPGVEGHEWPTRDDVERINQWLETYRELHETPTRTPGDQADEPRP